MKEIRVRFFSKPLMYLGGGEIQFLETANALQRLGVNVTLMPADKGRTPDIVHLFGTHGRLYKDIAQYCVRAGIPYVVSTIYASSAISPLRNIYRNAAVRLMRYPTTRGLVAGDRFVHVPELLENASQLLPNTIQEKNLILKTFPFVQNDSITVIHNGVERRFLDSSLQLFRSRYTNVGEEFVLNVARIEPRKNQLALIKAAKIYGFELVIVGDTSVDQKYMELCMLEAQGANVKFLGPILHDDPILASAYACAKVFCLPSREETPGIAALEALLAGANVVITKYGGAVQYFGEKAIYVDPYDVNQMGNEIIRAIRAKRPEYTDRVTIANEFDWDSVGRLTRDVYERCLSGDVLK